MKSVTKLLAVSVLMLFVFVFISCKKDKDDDNNSTTHKVMYKATVTNGTISDVSYTDVNNQQTTATGLDSSAYASNELSLSSTTVPILTFTANGASVITDSTTVEDSAMLKIQIIVDGNVVKTDSAMAPLGDSLKTTTSYNF